jgi:predicted nucleotidyltransferase
VSDLSRLSAGLDTSERTLRRAAKTGLIRADRLSARRLHVPDSERRYLISHWPILADLRAALRTEPNVRLAVLFGSTARGDDGPASDIDVLVDLQRAGSIRLIAIEDRLSKKIGRPVDLVRRSRADRDQTLMSEVIADGRVLVDRDAVWSRIAADPDEVRERAKQAFAIQTAEALARSRRAVSS